MSNVMIQMLEQNKKARDLQIIQKHDEDRKRAVWARAPNFNKFVLKHMSVREWRREKKLCAMLKEDTVWVAEIRKKFEIVVKEYERLLEIRETYPPPTKIKTWDQLIRGYPNEEHTRALLGRDLIPGVNFPRPGDKDDEKATPQMVFDFQLAWARHNGQKFARERARAARQSCDSRTSSSTDNEARSE